MSGLRIHLPTGQVVDIPRVIEAEGPASVAAWVADATVAATEDAPANAAAPTPTTPDAGDAGHAEE